MSIPQNFQCVEQQVLAATSTSSSVEFTLQDSASAPDLMIVNEGPNGAQIALSSGTTAPTALANAAASGTPQIKVPSGVVMVVKKNAARFVAAICESGDTAELYFHAGIGQ